MRIRLPIVFFAEVETFILNFKQNLIGPQTAKAILENNKAEFLTHPDFKIRIPWTEEPGRL